MKSILILLFLSPFFLFCQFQIGHTTLTFNDPTRNGVFGSGEGPGRQIQSEVYYPTFIDILYFKNSNNTVLVYNVHCMYIVQCIVLRCINNVKLILIN